MFRPTHAIKHTSPSGLAAYKTVRLWYGSLYTRTQWVERGVSVWCLEDEDREPRLVYDPVGPLDAPGYALGPVGQSTGPKEGKYELLTLNELERQLHAGDIVGIGRPEDFGENI